MKPNTKTKFSDRFSTKIEDIRPKNSQQNQEDEKSLDDMPDNLQNLIKQNLESKQNDQLLSFNDIDLAQVIDIGHGFLFANIGKKKYAWEI